MAKAVARGWASWVPALPGFTYGRGPTILLAPNLVTRPRGWVELRRDLPRLPVR